MTFRPNISKPEDQAALGLFMGKERNKMARRIGSRSSPWTRSPCDKTSLSNTASGRDGNVGTVGFEGDG
jgi:hypothetical protein